ncbi:golgin candidate 2 isoform X2 [Andrographis paniculata]|uniref:golgin candidate 2 isoform X2 n=1 Tax=Andrographis paniculata TaxID=175694 RepID=UPI0021E9066D|nr:golgin candidate 2 isoform X2 [Andrographis paniculata]
MAHWISSKLKAAETLLQQIDQQAAESLGKNEKSLSDDPLDVENSSRLHETKPLIKDQLKKKSPEHVVNQAFTSSNEQNINIIHRSNSDVNGENIIGGPLPLKSKSQSSSAFPDNDWTELLSVPDKKGVSGVGSVKKSINHVPGIQALKKDVKKPGSNLSPVDKKSEKVRDNGVTKSSRKLGVRLDNSISGDSDEKASNAENVMPRSSSIKFPSSAGELDRRATNLSITTDNGTVQNKETEELTKAGDGQKQHHLDSDHSSNMAPASHEREMEMKVEFDGGELFNGGTGKSESSTMDPRIAGSLKKASSPPSDVESNSETDTSSSSGSESEREMEERQKRRQQILAEKAAAKALQAIKDRENLVARLEGEKQSLEKIIEERAKQQVQEASELQTTMMETMEAVELEKQRHNNTRMEVLARLAKLESANADLARSLANAQKKLEAVVDRVADLRQQIHVKEAMHEGLRRKISSSERNGENVSRGVELELKMFEAEYSFINEKVERMQDQVRTLETSIETTRREIENPTDVEIELKQRLGQLTDHLIQKQVQVETLSSEKATLLFRIEAISRLVDENKAIFDSAGFLDAPSRNDVESGVWLQSHSTFKDRIQSSQRHLGSVVLQLDSLFCAGAVFLKRNRTARVWSLVYLICLHIWVLYILTSHSQVSEDTQSGAVISLENINNTGGV